MKNSIKGLLLSSVVMFIVLYVCDITKLIVTPLSSLGMTHWIPELFTIFLIGRYFIERMNKVLLPAFVGCVFLYPVLTYAFMNQLSFGIGTSSIFVAVLLIGVWTAK